MKKIKTALLSVFHKEGLEPLLEKLTRLGIQLYSTGGTYDFIVQNNYEATPIESLTQFPAMLGGRVKTLHPKVFGGILARRHLKGDMQQLAQYDIPAFDLVVVDLYPFEETVANTEDASAIIEKIDIGGIALIRAAAKNYKDVVVVPSVNQYAELLGLLEKNNGQTTEDERRYFAARAFEVSSHYDTAIFNWMNPGNISAFHHSETKATPLRYGENPHQRGIFYGNLEEVFEQLHGKAISYNNLQDLDAAVHLIDDFEACTFAILKHNNACGVASREKLIDAWKDALAGDPVSAFGGVLVANRKLTEEVATEINKLFFEIIIAPEYEEAALNILKSKKNRIILKKKNYTFPNEQFRSTLNGVLWQEPDRITETEKQLELKTDTAPTHEQIEDLLFANKLVKHTKSNAIVLVKNKQLIGSGTGQTSRVDALKQAIEKAQHFQLPLEGSVMASDAFFPFADSVELAHQAGIQAVIQPGGSIRDKDSIEYCNKNNMAMVFTGIRHFKH